MTATKTQKFTRAIRVSRNDQGQYSFLATWDQPFREATTWEGQHFEHEIIEPLVGWGEWTHAVAVIMFDERIHFFAR
jgi:hypothetical protein